MQASNNNPAALQKQVQELLQAKEAKEAELIECKQQLQTCNSDLTTSQGLVMAAETQLAAATAALSSSRQQLAEQADQLQANQAHLEELKQQLNNSQTAAEVMMHCSAMSAVAEPTHFVAACVCCATAWFYRSCCRSGKQPWLRCCQLLQVFVPFITEGAACVLMLSVPCVTQAKDHRIKELRAAISDLMDAKQVGLAAAAAAAEAILMVRAAATAATICTHTDTDHSGRCNPAATDRTQKVKRQQVLCN